MSAANLKKLAARARDVAFRLGFDAHIVTTHEKRGRDLPVDTHHALAFPELTEEQLGELLDRLEIACEESHEIAFGKKL